jgi:hypothetical protein
MRELRALLYTLEETYDYDTQVAMATMAQMHYCMFSQTGTLAANIKSLAKRIAQ